MHGTVSKYQVRLNRHRRRRLEAIVRRRQPSHWFVIRARVILMSTRRTPILTICAALSLDRQVVRRWRRRYIAEGIEGLKDKARSGRPSTVEPKVWQKVATVVVQSPTKFSLPFGRWSIRDLSAFLMRRYGWQVSRSSLSRFLRSMALKPHRIRYWLNPTDPDFDEKAAVICRLYLEPPPRTVVLSLDEKPGVQA